MIINNKCKNCAGELIFDPDSKELKCQNCASIVDIPDQNILNTKKFFTKNSLISEKNLTKYTQFLCSVCNRKHLSPTDTELLRCPSCGASSLQKTIKVDYVPDGIIPFRLNKQKALEAFKSWLKTKKFAPNSLKNLAKSQELVGFYIPTYNYDFNCFTTYSGVGIDSHRDHQGRTIIKRHPFRNVIDENYINYLESANTLIDSDNLRKMGNYDLKNLFVYKTEYLYGWLGAEINLSLQENFIKVQNQISQIIKNRIKASLHYERIENFVCTTNFLNVRFNYLYVPIWYNHYEYKNKSFSCFINGETGKISGKSPKSFWKIFFVIIGACLTLGTIAFLCATFLT